MTLPSAVIVSSVLATHSASPLLIFRLGTVPALGPAGAGWGLTLSFGAGSLVLDRIRCVLHRSASSGCHSAESASVGADSPRFSKSACPD